MSFIRKFIIKASGQITLPVTPESFEVSYGRHTETVNIHEVGDVNLPGGMALGTIKVGCMFPENDYPFALDSGEPYEYVERIEKIIKRKKPVRFVVSGTGINERVLIEEISYGERDGTGDVYATITMRGYRKVVGRPDRGGRCDCGSGCHKSGGEPAEGKRYGYGRAGAEAANLQGDKVPVLCGDRAERVRRE